MVCNATACPSQQASGGNELGEEHHSGTCSLTGKGEPDPD